MIVEEGLIKKMVAEAIGTFILVFIGTAALISTGEYIFGFGFALIAIVYAIGHISGAHVNPAVTLGLALTGRFPMTQVPHYWISQVIGALVASILVRLMYGNVLNLGTTQIAEDYSVLQGFAVELVMTGILVFVVHAVATDDRSPAAATGLAIGGTLLVIHAAAGTVTGGSVNPARSLAPAIVSGTFGDLWIYLIAPFIGGIVGAVAYEYIGGSNTTQIPAREGMTTEPHRRGRGRRRWATDERPERPAKAERERQKREQRPDRLEREQWQRTEQRSGRSMQGAAQRLSREPLELDEADMDLDDYDNVPAVEPDDLPPPRQRIEQRAEQRPDQRTVQRPSQPQRPEQRVERRTEQRGGQRPPQQRQRRPRLEPPEE